jgi:hypothetical protein
MRLFEATPTDQAQGGKPTGAIDELPAGQRRTAWTVHGLRAGLPWAGFVNHDSSSYLPGYGLAINTFLVLSRPLSAACCLQSLLP